MKKNLTNDIGIEINKLESENKKIDLQNEVYKKKTNRRIKNN